MEPGLSLLSGCNVWKGQASIAKRITESGVASRNEGKS